MNTATSLAVNDDTVNDDAHVDNVIQLKPEQKKKKSKKEKMSKEDWQGSVNSEKAILLKLSGKLVAASACLERAPDHSPAITNLLMDFLAMIPESRKAANKIIDANRSRAEVAIEEKLEAAIALAAEERAALRAGTLKVSRRNKDE